MRLASWAKPRINASGPLAMHRFPDERCVEKHTDDEKDQRDHEPCPKIVVLFVPSLAGSGFHTAQTNSGGTGSLITLPRP
jgi:hypothetical protein